MKELYPVNTIESKKIEALVDPETGEILDLETFEQAVEESKKTEGMKKSLINKVKISIAAQKAIKDEIDNLKILLSVQSNREASILRFLKTMIEIDGDIDFTTCGAKLAKNPPRVIVKDETKLSKYIKVELKKIEKLDKKELSADLKAGKKVDGATLVQETRVVIF